jgi:hypothetical protein
MPRLMCRLQFFHRLPILNCRFTSYQSCSCQELRAFLDIKVSQPTSQLQNPPNRFNVHSFCQNSVPGLPKPGEKVDRKAPGPGGHQHHRLNGVAKLFLVWWTAFNPMDISIEKTSSHQFSNSSHPGRLRDNGHSQSLVGTANNLLQEISNPYNVICGVNTHLLVLSFGFLRTSNLEDKEHAKEGRKINTLHNIPDNERLDASPRE